MAIILCRQASLNLLGLAFVAIALPVNAQWVQTSGPIQYGNITFLVSNAQIIFASNPDSGVFRSSDKGDHWLKVYSNQWNEKVNCMLARKSTVYLGTSNGIECSTDNGASWTGIGLYGKYIQNFIFSDSLLFACSPYGGLYYSTLKDTNWMEVKILDLTNPSVLAIVADNRTLFIAAYEGTGNGGVYRSTDNGSTWMLLSKKLGNPYGISSFATQDTVLYAGSGYTGIFRSYDKGETWENKIGNGLPYLGEYYFAILDDILFVGGYECGILNSTDHGDSWKTENNGLLDSSVSSILIIESEMFIGTGLGSVWRRPLSEMTGTNAVAEHPQASREAQAFPNPFSHSTTIRFSPTERGFAQVTVVNLLGETVARLFEGELEKGEHSFEWDASKCASGAHFCFVEFNGRMERIEVIHHN